MMENVVSKQKTTLLGQLSNIQVFEKNELLWLGFKPALDPNVKPVLKCISNTQSKLFFLPYFCLSLTVETQ